MAILTGREGTLKIVCGPTSTGGAPTTFTVAYADMNASVPDGHAWPDLTAVHNRGKYDATYSHLIAGPTKVLDPVDFTFSAKLDYTANKDVIEKALTGTTKPYNATTDLDGVLPTVAAADGGPIAPKTIVLDWSDGTNHYTKTLKGVIFPKSDIKITEAEDGVTLDVTGHVYGSIETVYTTA